LIKFTQDRSAAIVMFVFIFGLFAIGVWAHRPPDALPETAPAAEFSAFRALRHIEKMAVEPHNAGTDANHRVRQYIMSALKELGGEPILQDKFLVRGHSVGNPENVIIKLPGTANTKAVLFTAHYDSTPYGPGAADDLGGCGAMIEAYRALKAGTPLKNDVIFAFLDNEEGGGCGARSLIESEWLEASGFTVNLEARGVRGPSYIFEFSKENGWVVAEMTKSGAPIVSNSAMFDFYDRLPFGSDFGQTKHYLPGLNFAFIDYMGYYHTMNDKPSNVCPGSIQHHGEYIMAFARHFGNIPLDNVPKERDAVFFNTIGAGFIHYSGGLIWPLTILTSLVMAGVFALGLKKKVLTVKGTLVGSLLMLLTLVCVAVVLFISLGAAFLIRSVYMIYTDTLFGGAAAGLTIGVVTALYARFRRRRKVYDLAFGAMLIWEILLILCSNGLQGATYMFLWPLFFSLIGLGVVFLIPDAQKMYALRWAALAISAIPLLVIMPSGVCEMFSSLMIIGAPMYMMIAALTFGLLIPHLDIIMTPREKVLPVCSFGVGVIALLTGIAMTGFSPAKPKMNCVSYLMNFDSGEAVWVSADPKPDSWTSQFFPPNSERGAISEFNIGGQYMKAPAPAAEYAPPLAEVVSDETLDGARKLILRISSPRGAASVRINAQCEAEMKSLVINGRKVDVKGAEWTVDYRVMPRRAAEVVIETEAGKKVSLTLIDCDFSLPRFADKPYAPRPDWMIPEPNTYCHWRSLRSNRNLGRKTYSF